MVTDHESEYASQWAVIQSVAQKLSRIPETLVVELRQARINAEVTTAMRSSDTSR